MGVQTACRRAETSHTRSCARSAARDQLALRLRMSETAYALRQFGYLLIHVMLYGGCWRRRILSIAGIGSSSFGVTCACLAARTCVCSMVKYRRHSARTSDGVRISLEIS